MDCLVETELLKSQNDSVYLVKLLNGFVESKIFPFNLLTNARIQISHFSKHISIIFQQHIFRFHMNISSQKS